MRVVVVALLLLTALYGQAPSVEPAKPLAAATASPAAPTAAPTAASTASVTSPLVYGGDANFSPYESLDAQGRPQGFNIQLLQALSRETGIPVEIRLAPWRETMAALDAGRIDFASLAYSDERARKYDFLPQSWTLHQDVIFKEGRASYPQALDELGAEVVAVEEGSVMHEVLRALPELRRPVLRMVKDQTDTLALLNNGAVTAAAGNGLALHFAAQRAGITGLRSISVKTFPYQFAVRKGNAPANLAALQALAGAISKLQATGKFQQLVEENLAVNAPSRDWRETTLDNLRDHRREYTVYFATPLVLLLTVVAGVFIWNRSLRSQVLTRTQQLRDSQEAFGALINTVDGILWESDTALEFQFVSAQAERVLGYPLRDWLEKGFARRLILPEDGDKIFPEVALQTVLGHDHRSEFRVHTAEGRILWMRNYTTVVMEGGHPVKLRGVMVDITESRQAEEAVRQGEERLKLAMEAAEDGYWDWNIPAGKMFLSPRMFEMLGYSPSEDYQVEEVATKLVHPEDLPQLRAKVVDHLKGITPSIECEVRMLTEDGAWKWILNRGKVVARDENGRAVRATGTHRDMSERKVLEAQLQQAQKMEAVGQLAGGVAHDFNNLLTVIHGYSAILLEETSGLSGRPLTVRAVQEIDRAAVRAAALTRQLLAFSRRQVLQPKVLDLNDVLGTIEPLVGRLIGEDIELCAVPALNLGHVRADQGQLEQVLMNLVVNARDAMPNGGNLTICTANMDVDEAFASQRRPLQAGRYVSLSVTDTGHGMDAATQARIFEPFFTTKEMGKGTGLGLAMVYGIVKQSEGYIWVQSEVGRGTTFEIYLPRMAEAEVEPAKQRVEDTHIPPAKERGSSQTILLAEDESALRALAQEFLSRQGYRVLAAASGEEAIAIAENFREPIHLLLTDMIMPGITGQSLARTLSGQRPGLAVLYISGYTDGEIQNNVLAEGRDFLAKPFHRAALLEKVRLVLDGRQRAASA